MTHTKYKVWEKGDDEGNAEDFRASSPEDAAEQWVQQNGSEQDGNSYTMKVREDGSKVVCTVEVSIHVEVSYDSEVTEEELPEESEEEEEEDESPVAP
jgi:hypothetical protein